ncbi:hypothetical protein C2E23DRAFT_832917 [Lenzites betulinus]|nr:hypothetical protein C2E23DRAFT_832917 [Lenzites betulinus]
MASLSHILKVPSLDSSIGAVLLGVIVGSMLYGLTMHQTHRYFKLYPEDRLFLKVLVVTILILETAHTVVWIIVTYHYTITDAFDLVDILRGHWSVKLAFMITGFAVFVCQSFYACRVFLLGPRHRWLLVPAVITMFGGLSFALAAGIRAFETAHYIVDLQHISWLVSIAYGFAVATDVMLTSALVYVLQRLRTGRKRTDSILDVLIIYTVNTGLLTSIISIIAFVFALVIPGNLIYAAVGIVGAKLYANSVLALLNSRRLIDNHLLDDFNINSVASTPAPERATPRRRLCPYNVDSIIRTTSGLYPSSSKASTIGNQSMSFASGEVGIGI